MNSHLIAQIERDNHARSQEAHMFSDDMNQQSVQEAHIKQAHLAARSRSQPQQPSGHAETGKSLPSFSHREYLQKETLLTKSQVPEPEGATTTQKDTAAADGAEEMCGKLALMSGLGDNEDSRGSGRGEGESFLHECTSSYCAGQPPHEHDRLDEPEFLHRRGDGETFRNQCKSTYCAGEPPHEHDRLDEPEVLHPRRGGESSRWENKSSYPDNDYDLVAYRAEKTAASAPTPSSARPSSSSSGPSNSTQEQRPCEPFRYECKSSYCAGEPPHEHDRLDEPEVLRRRPSHDGRGVSRENGRAPRDAHKQQARPRFEAPYRRYGEAPVRRGASVPVSDEVEGLSRALSASMAPSADDPFGLL
jgi:hypothetical protein